MRLPKKLTIWKLQLEKETEKETIGSSVSPQSHPALSFCPLSTFNFSNLTQLAFHPSHPVAYATAEI